MGGERERERVHYLQSFANYPPSWRSRRREGKNISFFSSLNHNSLPARNSLLSSPRYSVHIHSSDTVKLPKAGGFIRKARRDVQEISWIWFKASIVLCQIRTRHIPCRECEWRNSLVDVDDKLIVVLVAVSFCLVIWEATIPCFM